MEWNVMEMGSEATPPVAARCGGVRAHVSSRNELKSKEFTTVALRNTKYAERGGLFLRWVRGSDAVR
eukprot:5925512-Prymnesium_polylepis.2